MSAGWDKPLPLREVARGPVQMRLAPDAAERARTARDLGLRSLPALTADLTVKSWLDGAEITGRFEAVVEQVCGVTLDPFEAAVEGQIEARVVPPGSPNAAAEDGGGSGAAAGPGRPGRALPGERLHIGRRHILDRDAHPVVIDWRAPVSRPFYRASAADPMGLVRRRRFGFAGAELTAYEDEEFTQPGRPTGPVSRILIEEIERPRSGPMRDIVATIQPDQDDIVRAGADQSLCAQGAPGTGKTAVGLHRVAYLLYAYPGRMLRGGVLVIGPNRAFLSYIRNVLPALGEADVAQQTIPDLVATVPVRATDSGRAARDS